MNNLQKKCGACGSSNLKYGVLWGPTFMEKGDVNSFRKMSPWKDFATACIDCGHVDLWMK